MWEILGFALFCVGIYVLMARPDHGYCRAEIIDHLRRPWGFSTDVQRTQGCERHYFILILKSELFV